MFIGPPLLPPSPSLVLLLASTPRLARYLESILNGCRAPEVSSRVTRSAGPAAAAAVVSGCGDAWSGDGDGSDCLWVVVSATSGCGWGCEGKSWSSTEFEEAGCSWAGGEGARDMGSPLLIAMSSRLEAEAEVEGLGFEAAMVVDRAPRRRDAKRLERTAGCVSMHVGVVCVLYERYRE